jgi:hypothetical protein
MWRCAFGLCEVAVFLIFGVVSARLQAASGLRPHRSLAKNQKSPPRITTLFLSML